MLSKEMPETRPATIVVKTLVEAPQSPIIVKARLQALTQQIESH